MQALAGQGLLVNRRHPDARGCFFAMPCTEHGGDVVRDLALQGGRAGLGQPGWTGTRSFGTMPGGRCAIINAATDYIRTPVAGVPWSQDISMVATILPTTITALAQCIIRAGMFALEITATSGVLRLVEDGVAVRASSTQAALVAGSLYRLGVRYRRSAGAIDFFINGVKDTVTGVAAITAASSTTSTFSTSNASGINGKTRDIRCWDRAIPDIAFERYYYNPNAFYQTPGPWFLKGVRAAGLGNFLPFMHPSLQS